MPPLALLGVVHHSVMASTTRHVKHDTCGGYNKEPYDECGVGNDATGFNCIKNSTTAMSRALQVYGQKANKKIVYVLRSRTTTTTRAAWQSTNTGKNATCGRHASGVNRRLARV